MSTRDNSTVPRTVQRCAHGRGAVVAHLLSASSLARSIPQSRADEQLRSGSRRLALVARSASSAIVVLIVAPAEHSRGGVGGGIITRAVHGRAGDVHRVRGSTVGQRLGGGGAAA